MQRKTFKPQKLLAMLLCVVMVVSVISIPAPAYAVTNVTLASFSGIAAPDGVRVRSDSNLNASVVKTINGGTRVYFDRYGYGQGVQDIWTGKMDYRWYGVSGTNGTQWIASGIINGNPSPNPPLTAPVAHQHSYQYMYEATHPHKEFNKCSSCGDVQWLGTNKYIPECNQCNPQPVITPSEGVGQGSISSTLGDFSVFVSKSQYSMTENIVVNWTNSANAQWYNVAISRLGTADQAQSQNRLTGNTATFSPLPAGEYQVDISSVYDSDTSSQMKQKTVTFTVAQANISKTAYVANTGGLVLRVRAEASINSSIKGTLPEGSVVTVTGEKSNNFYPVSSNGLTGWCSADYISFSSSVPTPTPKPSSSNGVTVQQGMDWVNGRLNKVTGSGQCVALVVAFCKEKFNWTTYGNARDYITIPLPSERWERIANTPEFVPRPGDIAVWNGTYYGHISIITSANVNTFVSVDQNVNGYAAKSITHNYYPYSYNTTYNGKSVKETCTFWGVIRPPYSN